MQTIKNDAIMDWDDLITSDDDGIKLLNGDYDFTVTEVTRTRYPGGDRIPACPMVRLTLTAADGDSRVPVTCALMLYRPMEWKISAFLRSVGLKKRGEAVAVDWSGLKGVRGRARFRPRTYKSDGRERQTNEAVRFLDGGAWTTYTPVPDEVMPWDVEEER